MAKRFHNAFSLVLLHDVSRLDYTQADGRPQIQIPMHLRGDVSLVTRTLEDPRWASSRSLTVATPANATRSAQHHYSCGKDSQ
jgi:hypothetical protein